MSRSAQITITSDELRERVEDCLDRQIPDHVWERSEPYARRKLDMTMIACGLLMDARAK